MEQILKGTSLHAQLLLLQSVYDDIDLAQDIFLQEARRRGGAPSCPQGCSSCCSGFTPELLPVEADRVAYHLLLEAPELLETWRKSADASEEACPDCLFHTPVSDVGGCAIYRARPLICRLFGFSAVQDKLGNPRYALCKWMPALPGLEPRRFSGSEALEAVFGRAPPTMAPFVAQAEAIDPTGVRSPLPLALPAALARLTLTLRFSLINDPASPIRACQDLPDASRL